MLGIRLTARQVANHQAGNMKQKAEVSHMAVNARRHECALARSRVRTHRPETAHSQGRDCALAKMTLWTAHRAIRHFYQYIAPYKTHFSPFTFHFSLKMTTFAAESKPHLQ